MFFRIFSHLSQPVSTSIKTHLLQKLNLSSLSISISHKIASIIALVLIIKVFVFTKKIYPV